MAPTFNDGNGSGRGPQRVEPLMGEADATNEWGATGRGHAVFLHTPSYDAACDLHTLFLVGRRGTGKTAVLRMLQYETREGKKPQYLSSWILDQEKSYRTLAINLRGSLLESFKDEELELVTAMMWRWVITMAAMSGVVWQANRHELAKADQLRGPLDDLLRFLRKEKLLSADDKPEVVCDPIDVLSERILEAMDMSTSGAVPLTPGRLVKHIEQRLFSN